MALTLRDSFTPSLALTPLATPVEQQAMEREALMASDSTQFGRGWTSAGYSGRAGDYANEAVQAGLRGDGLRAAYLKQLAQDEAARAEVWAPTTRSFTDIDSVGSALDWAGGALGNIRTSVAPMVGGMVGTGLGAAAGTLLRNPALGAKVGGFLGASIPAYQMEKGETAAGALLDPNNTASYEDIDRAGMAKGAINAGLEALVPYGAARSLTGLGKAVAKGEAKKHLGREVAKNAGEEFLTEGAQSLVGQGAENYLKGEDLTNFDYKQAFNEGMAGAVAGGGMGLVGGAADVAHTQFGKGVDKAKDFAASPMEKVGDAVADIGGKVGGYFGNKKDATEKEVDRLMKLSDEDFLEATMPKRRQSAADALREDERDLDDKSLVAKRNAEARTEAEEILKAPPRTYSSEVVAAANDVVVGRGDAIKLRDALRDQKAFDDADDMLRALEGGETKKSLMRAPAGLSEAGKKAWEEKVADNKVGGTDAINQSKTASQTPYTGDSFEYDSAPALKHTDKSELTFNYDSIQRSAGIEVAKKAESAGVGARVAYHIERQRRRESGKNVAAAESVKDEAQKTLDLAAILIKDRFDNYGKESGKASVKAAQSIGTRTAELQKVAGMITWARYGFQREAEAVQAIGDVFGAEGEALFNQAYGAGVQEGLIPRNPAKAAEIATKLRNAVLSNEQRRAAVMENLRPTLKHRATPDVVKGLVAKLEDIVKNGMRGENITKGGNVAQKKGGRSATDQRVLETLFGDEEHIAAALRPIIIAHENAQIGKAKSERGSATAAALEEGEQLDDQESDFADTLGESGNNEPVTRNKAVFHAREDNTPYDTRDDGHRAEMEAHKAKLDAGAREVGVAEQALEQWAENSRADGDRFEMTAKQRIKALEKLVRKHFPDIVKPQPLNPHFKKSASEAQLKLAEEDYAKRRAVYEREIESKAKVLDRRYKVLSTTEAAPNNLATQFSREEIMGLALDRDIDHPKNAPQEGTLFFEKRARGGLLITSAPMITSKMFVVQRRMGSNGSQYEDSAAGTANNTMKLLFEGITSMLENEELLSGRWGYVLPGGKKVYMDERDAVTGEDGKPVLHKKGDKAGTPMTKSRSLPDNFLLSRVGESMQYYRDAVRQGAKHSKRVDTKDYDPDDIDQPTHRKSATMWQKFLALKNLSKNLLLGKAEGVDLDKEQAQRLHKFVAHLQNNIDIGRKNGLKGDDLLSRSNHALLGKWMAALDLKVGTVEVADTPAPVKDGQVGDDMLSDYDPDTEIHRDSTGRVKSSNTEMAAQTVVGTTRRVEKADTGPLATKEVERDAEALSEASRDALVALEEMRDEAVGLLRQSLDKLLSAITELNVEGVGKLQRALFGEQANVSRKSYVKKYEGGKPTLESRGEELSVKNWAGLDALSAEKLGQLYFEGDADKGRALHGRLTHASDKIKNAISKRMEVLDNESERGAGRSTLSGDTVRENSEPVVRSGEGKPGASRDQATGRGETGVASAAGRPSAAEEKTGAAGRAKLLNQLKSVKPANAIHRKAIENLVAILEGRKEGNLTKAMMDMTRWDQTLGSLSERQREQLKTWIDKRGVVNEEQVPIEAYDDELGFDPEQAEFDREMYDSQTAQSKQQAAGKPADKATQDKVDAFLHKVLGDKVKVEFVDAFSDGSSGEWEASDTGTVIRIALNGDVMGTGFHEAIHDLFNMLRSNGGEKIIKQLERAAMSPLMQKRLERMLDGHPEAIEQLAKPEEAVAFMFQFWMLDPSGFNIGPETKSFFQKVKDFISKIVGIFSESTRGELMKRAAEDSKAEMTQLLLKTFAEGHFGNVENRQAVIDALNGNVEKHEAAMRHIGESVTRLWDVLNSKAGHLAMTAEGVIEATNNDYWKSLSLDFHQKAGTAMRAGWFGGRGGYSEAVRSETNKRMVHLERELKGVDQADLELARKHLSEGTVPNAKEAKRIHGILRDYLDDFQKYIAERKVTRLEQNQVTKEYVWVPIQFRKDYWPQVFNVDAVLKDVEQFKADLLQHHRKQLEAIAKEANAAVKAKRPDGAASKAQLAAATQQNITPEMIAEEILSNVVNRNQLKDIGETEGQLGITPAAAAVNRRTLDWLDMEVFDKYMDKDVVNILSTYTNSMVKRAEAQVRFGDGGERVQEQMDRGLLYEMGGNDLVEKAEAKLPGAIDGWKTRAAQYYEDYSGKEVPTPFSQIEPFPTLRSVGTTVHRAMVGKDQYLIDLQAAAKKAQGVEKATMGMEGTLGRDISPNARALSSWVTTYQNFRTLSLSLFQSFSDVMGVVREGGEFTDAWDTFVMGMREVRNTWKKELSEDPRFLRAEEWGAVDAGAAMESYGQMNNSVFMTGKAKALSDWFFRFNGMEGWNRGTRALAANVAERIITKWAKEGIDTNDKAAVARFERLYGAGAKTKHIKLDADGRLDINDLDNRAAVNRWVLDAIATPNGAIKALHANDPHYSTFYHLKNFSYAMHRVALKGAVAQARLGNYRPAAVLASGYIPIIIAANAVKEMLIPGDEPPWMQKGLGGWLGYGWDRAGLLGVPQMYAQNLFDADPAAVFGPSVDQIQNILSIPVPEIKVDLPGFDPMTLHKDHTLLGEGFGSLPFGNVLRRLEKLAA